ncbi:hypothetical protein SAMN05216390_1432 [Lachnospiraceae bacterium KH1T2]|nr:hypothetical protein SAMN05216390_1432 [Lachnospiraceae bacterium KH1T2]
MKRFNTQIIEYKIKYSKHISDNPRDINRVLEEALRISILSDVPDNEMKDAEFLMTADCSAGKTYAFAKDIFVKTHKNHINILASPNVAQVSQNSKKYNFKAVAGRNAVISQNNDDYIALNVIYDKLLSEINKITPDELKDVILVVDEAHQMVDAANYRKEALSDVKTACRKVAHAGGRVIYLTGTPMSILMSPPDDNPYCENYTAHINCVKIGTNGKEETLRNYKRCDIVPYSNVRHLPYRLAELADNVENDGGYYLIHNNDKTYNLHAVRFLERMGISAAAISSDDINYSKVEEIYTNNAYNDIIKDGKINFGPIGLGYQVIFTTSLLNNGTSIDELVYKDEDPILNDKIHSAVKCVYVCNKKEEFNLNDIEQFFVRIRFNHSSNVIVLPEELIREEDVERKSFDDFYRALDFGAKNNKARGRHRIPNLITKRANEEYCKYLLSNKEILKEKVREELDVDVNICNTIIDSADIYENGNWIYSMEEVSQLCNIIDSASTDKESFYKFIAWNVDIDGTNKIREKIKEIDPAIAKQISRLLLLYHMGTGAFDMSVFEENLKKAFEIADMEYKKVGDSLKELEKTYVKGFFSMAKANKAISSIIRDFVVINENAYGKADIRKTISKIVYGCENKTNTNVKNNDLKQLREEAAYRYYQAIFSSRLFNNWITMFGSTLKQSGKMISWDRLCSIGETFTGEMICELTNYIRVFNGRNEDSIYRICQIAAELKSDGFAQIFDVKMANGIYNWKNTLIDYNKCSLAVPKLREIMRNKYHYDIKKSDDYIRRMILRLYGYMFTYRIEHVTANVLKNGGLSGYVKDSTAIYLFNERKSINSFEPIMLTFFDASNYKKKQLFDNIPTDLKNNVIEFDQRTSCNKYIKTDNSGKRFYDIEQMRVENKNLDVDEYYTIYIAESRNMYNHSITECVALAKTDLNGVLIEDKVCLLDKFYSDFKNSDDLFKAGNIREFIVPTDSELIFKKNNEFIVNEAAINEELLRIE